MGSIEARQIGATLDSIFNLEYVRGDDFRRIANRIRYLGTSDYQYRKAIVYRENFMNELYNLKQTSPEFEKLYNFFNKIKNPIEFFNTTRRSTALEDFFEWYQNPHNYGNFRTMEELADNILSNYIE